MWPWALLLLLVPPGKRSSSAPAMHFDRDSVIVRLLAGDVVGQLYTRPRLGWSVTKGAAVLAQGTGDGETVEPARPLLEAFAAATEGLPITAYFSEGGRVLTIAVYRIEGERASLWGWTATDGAHVSNGLEDSRGRALLAALDRAEDGPAGEELEGTGTDG